MIIKGSSELRTYDNFPKNAVSPNIKHGFVCWIQYLQLYRATKE